MNAHTHVELYAPAEWCEIVKAVNAWRGACLQYYSMAELAVTETLASLSEVQGRGETLRLRHLAGQRLADLSVALGDTGPFAREGKQAVKSLGDFRQLERYRTFLAHGSTRITVERNGNWIVIIEVVLVRAGQTERTREIIDQDEAEHLRKLLQRTSQRLYDRLRNLRASVTP